ncbi:barstar family protein [Mycobacteroides chelonae]|uniref:Ribonuclease inhibitor n=1 Tax=Mycobacteroides chelonae TaxID=1774 RepID=A0A1S1M204_MYCCH|nr:barstar family protein [Mycobacteroides chelonae]OHU28627.1 ribonuclease inhibitor [Mycobacteroides chelonae]OHU32263.1 ribonuclease inhibitor [Mycobacteroides chelonae]OHU65055.1 ribonuclease inhibitor [Mycobacteroides chelonae]OHU76563.1 ribonuclease inhibitor [Mycobacteroides chelonae]QQG87914.1 ribonuclease inhibitor [Mycobacteroides chelonae]
MKTYVVEGSHVRTRADFFTELGRAVNGPGGYFGSNLDALVDCLRGGFGTPDDEPFRFVLQDATRIKSAVGKKDWDAIEEIFEEAGVPLTARTRDAD